MTVSGATGSSSTTGTSYAPTTNPASVDWTALIQSEVNAKLAPATAIQTSITANEAKISAYQQMQTLLSSLATAALPFSTSNTSSLSDSAFGASAATVSANGDVSPSAALGLTVNNGAPNGTYTLTIEQLAQAQEVGGTDVASASTALGYTGAFSLGLAGGTSATISVNSSMSLADIAGAINAQQSQTNVQASVVEVSSSQYELLLTGTQDGVDITTSSSSGDDVLGDLGVTDQSGNFVNQLQAAQPSEITLDGISMTRNTNDISDVLSNTTLHLYQATPSGTSIAINIGPDASQIATDLQALVTAYNAYRDYVSSQQQTGSDGTAASGTVLFGDGTMNDVMMQLQDAMNTTVGGLSLNDLGLSFSSTNDLELDTTTLQNTLTSNFQGVEALLATQTQTSLTDLSAIASGQSAPGEFQLDVTVGGAGQLTSASVDGDSSLFTVTGNTIIGNTGTSYAGMAFSFTGNKSESIVVTSAPGIASLLNSIGTTAADPTTGTLQSVIYGLQTQDTSLQQQQTDIEEQASIYQTQLQTQYAQYQASIQQATNTLTYLQAILGASSTNG